jgi:hypothetical protein
MWAPRRGMKLFLFEFRLFLNYSALPGKIRTIMKSSIFFSVNALRRAKTAQVKPASVNNLSRPERKTK